MKQKTQNLFFVFTIFFCYCFSQDEVKILQSNHLENKTIKNVEFDMFCGNVIAEYKTHKLYCDTILVSKDTKHITASSKKYAKIIDSEGAKIQSKKIEFLKNDSIINFTKDVVFKKNTQTIYTDHLIYNLEKKIVYYKLGGKLIDENNTITSTNGLYHTREEFGQFSKKVNIKSDSYLIESENLDIDNVNEIIFFNEKSQIISDSTTLVGNMGFLNKIEDSIKMWGDGRIFSENKIIYSDTIIINNKIKETILLGNVEIHEKDKMRIYCQHFIEKDEKSELQGAPSIRFLSESDSLLIEGTKMFFNNNDSILSIIKNTYISGDSIQGKCEDSIFDMKSEKITMKTNPVLWTKKDQITGDTIYIYTKSETLDSIYIPKNSFILSENISKYYNQVKGNELKGKFKNGKLDYIHIKGNTILKYFEKHKESNEIKGMNDVICNTLFLYFDNGKIKNISFKSEPDAIYTPKNLINETELSLEGIMIRFNEKKY